MEYERKRRGLRLRVEYEAAYSAGREEGTALLVDLSESGALLARASRRPRIGTQLRVYLFLPGDAPVEIEARVVRFAGDGFAVEHKSTAPALRRFLDDTAVILGEGERAGEDGAAD